jgi:hypothetical protein
MIKSLRKMLKIFDDIWIETKGILEKKLKSNENIIKETEKLVS